MNREPPKKLMQLRVLRLGFLQDGNVVIGVARTMEDTLREVDFVARLGGDEFALLLSETKAEDIRGVLNKLQTALLEAMKAKDWRVTFSIGAVTFNDPPATPEEMIAKADELMYAAKLSGKNRTEHSILDRPNQTDHLVRCSRCRTSFATSSHACPICGCTALMDLHPAEHHAHTQRGVQAYITNLERELTGTLRLLEAILDILTEAEKLEHSGPMAFSVFVQQTCRRSRRQLARPKDLRKTTMQREHTRRC